jgi:2-polyprenyl-6-hydroxyphenyl methylase/3-demethylubiquinone-9 3-methyltransferase
LSFDMTPSAASQHGAEVQKGERFEFGKNWRRFLSTLNEDRIALAEQSLQKCLASERLDGKKFVDIGSGSGLLSLAVRRLGARVLSFDYDPQSVACTRELRRRYFERDPDWSIEEGSVLDRVFLGSLGTFDIVYAWGVLHHTGAMWDAIDNVKPLVKNRGQLFLAIYNDQAEITNRWRHVKETYNRLRFPWRQLFATFVIVVNEGRTLRDYFWARNIGGYIRDWTEYPKKTARGMSRWHDWIDWIGGYPYECATIEEVVDFVSKDGFRLSYLFDNWRGYGCNEFVFQRVAENGVRIENPLPQSRLIVRRSGHRLMGPFRHVQRGYTAKIPAELRTKSFDELVLFRDRELIGAIPSIDPNGEIVIAPPDWSMVRVEETSFHIVPGKLRALAGPFKPAAGYTFIAAAPDLSEIADTPRRPDRSPVGVFEDGRQLPFPHATHRDIAQYGAGRFSHWSEHIFFSSLDNTNPNTNRRAYKIVIAEN